MKAPNAIIVAGVAAATLLGSLGLWRSLGQAVAAEKVAPKPSMTVDGVTLTLDADKKTYKPDEKPVLTLTAVNATGSPASLTATVRAMSMAVALTMSRRGPISRETWQAPCQIALGPNETKTFTITAPKGSAAGNMITFTVMVGKTTRALAGASVPGPLLPSSFVPKQGQAPPMQAAKPKPVRSKL